MKRVIDFIFSFIGIIFLLPIIIFACLAIYFQDKKPPFYIAKRVGKNNKIFNMIKLRSMVVGAENSKIDSTSSNDPRITKIGKFIRKFKLDELSQFHNVLIGEMSLVGPRPNVKRETNLYTNLERKLINTGEPVKNFFCNSRIALLCISLCNQL